MRRGRPPSRPWLSTVCSWCEAAFTYRPEGACRPRKFCSTGCWSAACNAARQKVTLGDLAAAYLAGQTTRQIGRAWGCSQRNVARRLRAAGITRPKGRPRRAVAA